MATGPPARALGNSVEACGRCDAKPRVAHDDGWTSDDEWEGHPLQQLFGLGLGTRVLRDVRFGSQIVFADDAFRQCATPIGGADEKEALELRRSRDDVGQRLRPLHVSAPHGAS
jgi:hypothetical protein